MKGLPVLLLSALPILAFAGQAPVKEPVPANEPVSAAAMFDRLERISLPIGKGALLQDRRGCLWSVMEGEKAPRLVALTDETNKPLCQPAAAVGKPAPAAVAAPSQTNLPSTGKL